MVKGNFVKRPIFVREILPMALTRSGKTPATRDFVVPPIMKQCSSYAWVAKLLPCFAKFAFMLSVWDDRVVWYVERVML